MAHPRSGLCWHRSSSTCVRRENRSCRAGRVGCTRKAEQAGPGKTVICQNLVFNKFFLKSRSPAPIGAAPSRDGVMSILATALRRIAPYEVIKSMIRMIATELLVFWVPSVVSALAQVQTSPFLTVNFVSF